MTSFEPSKAFIAQAGFVTAADELLAKAESSDTVLREVVESAQQVLNQLGNIATEKLVVQPPLSEEQIGGYTKSATTIVNIGQKALGSLDTAATQREATQKGDTIKATGYEAKSSTKTPKPVPKPKPTPKKPGDRKPKAS